MPARADNHNADDALNENFLSGDTDECDEDWRPDLERLLDERRRLRTGFGLEAVGWASCGDLPNGDRPWPGAACCVRSGLPLAVYSGCLFPVGELSMPWCRLLRRPEWRLSSRAMLPACCIAAA